MKNTTLLFLVQKDGEEVTTICLAMKKRGFGMGRYNGVGGKVEQGESIEDAVLRETKEEIGVQALAITKQGELTFRFPHQEDWDQLVHVYLCESWKGEVTESEERRTYFPTTIVPLEDFYPSSVSIRTINKMPYCFWRTITTYSEFMSDWGQYDKSQYVVPKFSILGDIGSEQKPFYFDFISQDVDDGNVELIKYYSQKDDEFIVIANGIWISCRAGLLIVWAMEMLA